MQQETLLSQYLKIKQEYKETIVFFRLGDFYEMFFDDAKITASILGLTLTQRELKKGIKIPMAGVPHHASESYIQKLLERGYKVAICEQTNENQSKNLIKREVIRVITPGTNIYWASSNQPNFIMSVFINKNHLGLAMTDICQGIIEICQVDKDKFDDIFFKIQPKELILPQSREKEFEKYKEYTTLTLYEDFYFDSDYGYLKINEEFESEYAKELLRQNPLSASATGALISYIKETQRVSSKIFHQIKTYTTSFYIDNATLRSLEIIKPIYEGGLSLADFLSVTNTPMGLRFIRYLLLHPLIDPSFIKERQEAICELIEKFSISQEISKKLKKIGDLERLCSKVEFLVATPKDLISLKNSLIYALEIKEILRKNDFKTNLIKKIEEQIKNIENTIKIISLSIKEDAPSSLKDGGIIKDSYSKELFELKAQIEDAKKWIETLQEREIKRTKISSLKVGYNKVFGYYIEITKPNLKYVPQDYIRKQTLVNAERFITAELKEKEALVLSAQQRINQLEYEIFCNLREEIKKDCFYIHQVSEALAMLDVLSSFANICILYDFNPVKVNTSGIIILKDAKHPILAAKNQNFIPNDVFLDNSSNRILVITGPNMAGKSTYIRQVALNVILAQVFGFACCKEGSVGVTEGIFARIGAADFLYKNQSTFMVEMIEVANILHNATEKSLVILDEIGRGTSTYDGMSIAWSVISYIVKRIKAKTLFATHYHELIELERKFDCIKNYHLGICEDKNQVVFTYKLKRGGITKSYGIEVAKLAGLPDEVIKTAKKILNKLENDPKVYLSALPIFRNLQAEGE